MKNRTGFQSAGMFMIGYVYRVWPATKTEGFKTSNPRFPALLSCPVCYKQTCLLRPGTWHHCKQAESLAVDLRHICVKGEQPKTLPVPEVMNIVFACASSEGRACFISLITHYPMFFQSLVTFGIQRLCMFMIGYVYRVCPATSKLRT